MSLRVRKLWIWVLVLVIAAGVVVFVWSRAGGDDLVVQLVDKETGKPMSHVNVKILEVDAIPLLFKCEFLPWRMRRRVSARTTKASDDGTFRARRMVGASGWPQSHIVVEVDGGRKFYISYFDAKLYLPRSGDEFIPVPKEGTLVLPVDPAWMREKAK